MLLSLTIASPPFIDRRPGSPSVLSSMIVSIEQHVDYIADIILKMRAEGRRTVEATPAAQAEWVAHVNELASGDVMKTHPSCSSWYLGANIPGKTRVFMPYIGGVGKYRAECDEVVRAGYKGFVFK